MPRRLSIAMLAIVLMGVSRGSDAAFLSYNAVLTGPSEATPNASPGFGTAVIDFDTTANTLRVRVSFTGLTGTTTASHIHAATATPGTGTAGVATTIPNFAGFPLGVTAGTYDSGLLDLTSATSYNPAFVTANGGTTASAAAALNASAAAGKSYLNIHTSAFPGGEIRGFLTPVPEPTSLALMATGVVALIGYASRAARRGASVTA